MKTICVKDWTILPQDNTQNTLNLQKLLSNICGESEITLEFEQGIYHFYPDFAKEYLLYISNHDEDTIKRVAFPVIEQSNLTVKGNQTKFIFHADIIPFYFHQCNNIKVTGISIDYAKPIYSEAEILQTSDKQMTIKIDKQKYPFQIKYGCLYFPRENSNQELYRWLEMNRQTNEPEYNISDLGFGNQSWGFCPTYEEISDGVILMTLSNENEHFLKNSKVGNMLILRHHLRTHPCFYITDSKNITISHVDIYHASGMAFIAERTQNITLFQFNVKINPENPRIFTATADATHFVYCYGEIKITDCLFENQLDDPVNIHGIYARIDKIIDDTKIIVKLVHEQQKGVDIGKSGQMMGVVDNESMLTYHNTVIKQINPINKDFIEIEFETPCKNMQIGHVVENLSYVANVTIKGCIFRNNRARGLLLTSAGRVLIEDNKFHVSGAAILIEGDANNWFESGGTNEIIVRNNEFIDCCYVNDWGKAPIQVTPSATKTNSKTRYHKKLIIENNKFSCFDQRLIYAKHIEKIIFKDNQITLTDTYLPLGKERFQLFDVLSFEESGNKSMTK